LEGISYILKETVCKLEQKSKALGSIDKAGFRMINDVSEQRSKKCARVYGRD